MILGALLLAATIAATPVTAHRAVNTTVPLAQTRFDTALTELYAYAGPASAIDFDAAALSDPHLAIAFWGKALAEGSDLNNGLTEERFTRAKADALKAQALEAYATPDERALIDAVIKRYAGEFSDRLSDETSYEAAMQAFIATHPDDDDVTMLLVEAIMERTGMHWNEDGTPQGDTSTQILKLTQTVLARTPQQLMANHLCIHIYDNSPDRTPAIDCAQRLDAMTFAPNDEHLAHMPAHTWIELGDGRKADASSERAWQLHPDYYAQHDIYVGMLAAVYSGDAQRLAVWEQRYKPFADPAPIFSLASTRPDIAAIAAAQRDESAGRIDAAAKQLQSAIRYQRDTFTSEFLPVFPADERLGALYYRAGRFDDASAAFADALRRRPSDPRLLYGMAQTLTKLGRSDEAATYNAKFQSGWAGGPLTMADF